MGLFPDADAVPDAVPDTVAGAATPYRVLARKYRPRDFDDLLGQEAVVRTLANAIRTNRLAQAWLLTGVRGVGKTSTARIIAKALNCIGPDGKGGPTIHPCGVCANCTAIAAGQHIDVLEMDAASNTGVDNIREIIEAVRYASVSARYKVYIVDEVHMLSKGAFNALLKTLEEPPPHVKFIFATTEVEKLPATILSRCQRFDLRRVPADLLADHFAKVCAAEAVEADADALAIVARMAEGSVRDGLSILDQAIALSDGASGGRITADAVRAMLGLAGRGRTVALLQALVDGEPATALGLLDGAYDAGVEPQRSFEALLDFVHLATRARVTGNIPDELSPEERAALDAIARDVGFPALHRLWQLLLRALGEIRDAPVPRHAAEMAALRIAHAAHLPDPERLQRLLEQGGASGAEGGASDGSIGEPGNAPVATGAATNGNDATDTVEDDTAETAPLPATPEALIALFEARREALIAHELRDQVGIVAIDGTRLALATALGPEFGRKIGALLDAWTGRAWQVEVSPPQQGVLSEHEKRLAYLARLREESMADGRVRALLGAFPDAKVHVEPIERSKTA